MTNHLQTTKEAYLEMMKSLLEERREITQMYYEVKKKVDEIDKLLMAGDSGKVSTGQAAEIMAYAELFNKREKEPKMEAPAPREKLAINIDLNDAAKEAANKFKNMAQQLNERFAKDLPKPRQATAAELIASSVEPVKEDKHILPVEPNKPKKRVGRRKFSVHSQQGVEEMVKILQKYANEQAIQVKEFYNHFNEEVVEVDFASFQAALSKAKRKDSRIGKAGYGYYIYQIL